MPPATTEGKWAIVGKIGAVVAIVGGLIGIYNFLQPKEARLSCRCEGVEVDIPFAFEPLRDELTQLRTITGKYEIRARLGSAGITGVDLEPRADKFATSFSEELRKLQAPDLASALDHRHAFVECDLVNEGK